MGKALDYIMTNGDWEKMQRIQFYKKFVKAQNERNKLQENMSSSVVNISSLMPSIDLNSLLLIVKNNSSAKKK